MRCQGCRQSFDRVFKWQTPGAGGGWSKHRWVASTPLSHLNLGRLALRPLAASTARAQLPVTQISDLCLHRISQEMNWKTWTGFFYDRERPGVEGCDRANPDSRSVFCVLLLRQFLLWGEVVVFLLSWGGWGLPAEILYLILSTFDWSFDSENLTTSLNGVSFTISWRIVVGTCIRDDIAHVMKHVAIGKQAGKGGFSTMHRGAYVRKVNTMQGTSGMSQTPNSNVKSSCFWKKWASCSKQSIQQFYS